MMRHAVRARLPGSSVCFFFLSLYFFFTPAATSIYPEVFVISLESSRGAQKVLSPRRTTHSSRKIKRVEKEIFFFLLCPNVDYQTRFFCFFLAVSEIGVTFCVAIVRLSLV